VPVVAFDSNNTRRDKDVAGILRYKEFPAITIEVLGVEADAVRRVVESDSGRVHIEAKVAASTPTTSTGRGLFRTSASPTARPA
jgi:hypothetical protein